MLSWLCGWREGALTQSDVLAFVDELGLSVSPFSNVCKYAQARGRAQVSSVLMSIYFSRFRNFSVLIS